ncbi:hypothetical protein [Paraherbaspirillum soli]|uniref:Uncharacterized protein n=1 Tax=Paraherbaspirillum soli TaxID=631222 RepID=A0ABW0M934_9BURK
MKKILFSLGVAGAVSSAAAAPMDAFLSANPSSKPGEVQLEAAYDLVNRRVDVFNVRNSDSSFAGTNVGDYHGAHLRGGWAISPRIWVDGGFWERRIDYRSDLAKIHSWQLAAQYKLVEGAGYQPSIALRLGAWGNYADELKKSSSTTMQGVTLNSVSASKPKDNQYQLDLIGSSKVLDNLELSMFAGVGHSKVSLDSVQGSTTLNGCNYNLAFGPTEVVGTLAPPCSAGAVIDRFTVPNSLFGIDVNRETQYSARYYHGGLMLKWTLDDWQLRAGFEHQSFNRNHVDDIIRSRGGATYKSNNILIGDISYKLFDNTAIFLRGQYMTNQFVGEIPFAYNTLTASRFNKHYGFISTGLVMTF